ncbi:MAG TPA: hypothetical protein VFB80_00895 [Pirellulaceae bacterium]|nr:hypothetical protein [Pirellulaceae bacterium]
MSAATISDAEPATSQPPAGTASRMRLSIAHLLLWMAGTALVVALFPKGWLAGPDEFGSREIFLQRIAQRQTLERLSVVAVAPCYGAALASLLVAGVRLLWRRPGFPSLPGHWPLVNLGLWVLIVGAIVGNVPDYSPTYNLHVVVQDAGVPLVILLMLLLTVAVHGVVSVRQPLRWRIALGCQLAAAVLPVIGMVLMSGLNPAQLAITARLILLCWYIAALVSVLAGLWDFICRERFDLFHWVGVVSLLGILAHPPLTWLIADIAF